MESTDNKRPYLTFLYIKSQFFQELLLYLRTLAHIKDCNVYFLFYSIFGSAVKSKSILESDLFPQYWFSLVIFCLGLGPV